MKKFFTLIALLVATMGANAAAEWVEDYKIDYSTLSDFPFYVMGYAPSIIDGVMVDNPVPYRKLWRDSDEGYAEVADQCTEVKVNGATFYQQELEENPWRQYIIANEVPMELDVTYTVKVKVKASDAVEMNLQFGNWGKLVETKVSLSASDDFQDVEWEVSGCTNSGNGFICVQPGTSTATIEWKSLTVSHQQKEQRPVEWIEDLVNGDAEKSWAELGLADVAYNDMENNFKICAWSKEKGHNMDETGEAWNPFPATIGEEEVDGKINHFFIVKGQPATTEGDASAWDNQFWIQSPKAWKAGTQLKIHFRYKASAPVSSTDTQIHKQTPSDYLIWHAIGNIAFTEEWQEFDGTMTIADDMAEGWSIAFNLNSVVKDAVDFYFDDLSWQHMKLDEGLFVAAANTETGIEYDFDNAEEFTQDPDDEELMIATVGTQGKQDTWVNEIMISTVRGNDTAFKGATLKPSGAIEEDGWVDYTEGSLAKIKLPAAGVWKISIATDDKQMMFEKIEGEESKEPIEIVPNPTLIVVNGQERDYTSSEQPGDEEAGIPAGTGNPWDNQFFIVANRTLEAGEATHISFKYRSSIPATSGTQSHAAPGQYIHWGAIGTLTFDGGEEWQDFDTSFTIPSECAGKDMQSIAFNMAEIKEACVYEIKDVEWYLEDMTETLIDFEGTKNFFVKEGAGTDPYQFGTDPGDAVLSIATDKASSTVTYNLAGQRVTNNYKGIVVKDGKKYLAK